jgi:ATP-dependent Clp protease ATP-binding subunit ClpB
MDASTFTSRSVEVINAASTAAVAAGNAQIEPVHLAFALLRQDGGITPTLLEKAGVDTAKLAAEIDELAVRLPKASGATVSTPSSSPALTRVLAKALELAREMGDEYVATEHLLLALAEVESPVRDALQRAGATEAALGEAVTRPRS